VLLVAGRAAAGCWRALRVNLLVKEGVFLGDEEKVHAPDFWISGTKLALVEVEGFIPKRVEESEQPWVRHLHQELGSAATDELSCTSYAGSLMAFDVAFDESGSEGGNQAIQLPCLDADIAVGAEGSPVKIGAAGWQGRYSHAFRVAVMIGGGDVEALHVAKTEGTGIALEIREGLGDWFERDHLAGRSDEIRAETGVYANIGPDIDDVVTFAKQELASAKIRLRCYVVVFEASEVMPSLDSSHRAWRHMIQSQPLQRCFQSAS